MSSTKINQSRMKVLLKLSGEKDFNFIKDSDKTIKMIQDKYNNLNSQKSYLSSIMSYVRDELKDPELSKEYNIYHKELRIKIAENLSENTKDEKFIEWGDIIKYRSELKQSATNKGAFFDYLLLSLYTYNPPLRANYNKIRITKKNLNTDENLLIDTKKPKFIIKSYKTSKTGGDININIGKELKTIIDFWMKHYSDDKNFLFKMTANQLSKAVSKMLFKKFKRGSINVLRKSYLSHIFDNFNKISNKEFEEIARQMGTSVGTSIDSYRKVD